MKSKRIEEEEIDWSWKAYHHLGYRVTEDAEDKMFFNEFCNLIREDMKIQILEELQNNLDERLVYTYKDMSILIEELKVSGKREKSIFQDWVSEIRLRLLKCNDLEQLKKTLSDELYGVEEYMNDSKETYEECK